MQALYMPTTSMTVSKGGEYRNDRGPNHYPRFHEGADISIGVGTDIYGSGNGVVDLVANTGKVAGYGLYVRVVYNNVSVINSHMSSVKVSKGDRVSVSTLLGYSGGSKGSFGAGDATGPHDHLELRSNGVLQNPFDYLNSRTMIAATTAKPLPQIPLQIESVTGMILFQYIDPNDKKNHGRVVAVDPVSGCYRYPGTWEVNAIVNEVRANRITLNPLSEPEWSQTMGPLKLIPTITK